ncbi:hypothetical protein [Nannocystis sp.]|uniref:hypothetical protein n=1 Tax=Nannocystis sp. TaxID=1962667 RepID=UPI0025EF0029|nr:hypothetical protein [Nannocystis sp.]
MRTEDGHIVAIGKSLTDYNAIDCGLFLCTPAIFPALAAVVAARGDASLSEGMAQIGAAGLFFPFEIGDRWWQDVDTPDMLRNATELLERHALASAPAGRMTPAP